MNRKALVCFGIILALLLGLFGQHALALCVSPDHRSVEVAGHPPCEPAPAPQGQHIGSGSPCFDIALGYTMEASLSAKRDAAQVAQVPTGGELPWRPADPAPKPHWQPRTSWGATSLDLSPHLHSLRTVVLLI